MKISREWLQEFFVEPLPAVEVLAEALTFHAFEIEGIENDILDVKVTANRGHDCLSYRGIAKEVSAILQLPIKSDPFRQPLALQPMTDTVRSKIDDTSLCRRFTTAHLRGVNVATSPLWLQKRLEAMGQKSINNVVDATNYVMFHLGQPIHAFDAGKLTAKNGVYAFAVRNAKEGEAMRALDGKDYTFTSSMVLVTDGESGKALGIAGVKGGEASGITEATTEIIIECANFDGVSVRKTAQALKLRTDASARFEQGLSQEMTGFAIRAVADLIVQLAGGEIVGFADAYPISAEKRSASVTLTKINAVLGTKLESTEVAEALTRLDLPHTQTGDTFDIQVPFERLDLSIAEDLIEEVGRVIGYDAVPATLLLPLPMLPTVNHAFTVREHIREMLAGVGFSEVFTSVFTEKGERLVANKIDGVKPYLRSDLFTGLRDALDRNQRIKDLIGVSQIKLFEIGTVWRDGKEIEMLGIAVEKQKNAETASGYARMLTEGLHSGTVADVAEEVIEIPLEKLAATFTFQDSYDQLSATSAVRYQPFSKYPFIVRDVAFWVAGDTSESQIRDIITASAGDLLVRLAQFDRFLKDGRVSYAFRLVFQSFDKTLTDGEANERMESVHAALKKAGFEIR